VKGKLILTAAFLAAFVITTIAIMYLNDTCDNIFAFDFTAPKTIKIKPKTLEQAKAPPNLIEKGIINKLAAPNEDPKTDSVMVEIRNPPKGKEDLTALADSIKKIKAEVKKQQPVTTQNVSSEESVKEKVIVTKEYKDWTKKTAGLYEAMDSKRAAKIIQNYSDNVARDIIYAMKKKKAADILSQLNPEVVQRIIKVRQ